MPNKGGKLKHSNPYTITELYEDYIRDISESSPYWVSKKDYIAITDYFMDLVTEELFSGKILKLPFNLGHLYIRKKRTNYTSPMKSIDWALSKKYGKHIYHLNEHSGGFKYTFHWNKTKSKVRNKAVYQLIMTRTLKRKLAKLIKSGDYDYYEYNFK